MLVFFLPSQQNFNIFLNDYVSHEKEKKMLDYYLEQNRIPEGSGEYHGVVTHSEWSSQADFIRILGKTLGGVTEGEAMRVLSALATAAQEQFLEGRPFSIEGLGTFRLSTAALLSSPVTFVAVTVSGLVDPSE